ncbi:MAG: ATP-binding cassette domain-containing protein [Solobacterium sp.]|nr:ATP-binding cassette domain-containing protein [Solobacterium sp.]
MGNINDTLFFGWQAFSWLLTAAGIWKILEKCGQHSLWALMPGIRYYKLSQVAMRERDGINVLLFELPTYLLMACVTFLPMSEQNQFFIAIVMVVMGLIMIVYKMRVISGLTRVFGMSIFWVLFWTLTPWLASIIWGFSPKYQPVNLGRITESELLAGTRPAELPAAFSPVDTGPGLSVNIRERTVRDFLRRRYLLKDINLTIPNGSLVLLLGGSGSGKTTLVNAIIGYEKADATILLNGVDVYENYEQMKYRIGYVPQQDLLRQNDTVTSTLHDAARLRMPAGTSYSEMRQRVNEVMETLGMSTGRTGLVARKSGGQKKRISIGMELISDPELFILDEPDSGLDGVIARELFEKLRDIADTGKIVITITHIPDRVADLFDYVIVLARDSGKVGRLAFFGTPEEAKKFFGQPNMERIVMCVNRKDEGGEGRADEFIEKYARMTMESEAADD